MMTQHVSFLEQRCQGEADVYSCCRPIVTTPAVCDWSVLLSRRGGSVSVLQEILFLFKSSFDLPVPVKSPF